MNKRLKEILEKKKELPTDWKEHKEKWLSAIDRLYQNVQNWVNPYLEMDLIGMAVAGKRTK